MSIKFKQLTGYAKTEIRVIEPSENGGEEELVHSPTHRRITSEVLEELDRIEAKLKAENEKAAEAFQEKQKNAKDKKETSKANFLEQKNIMAHQLAYLVRDTDIIGEDDKPIPPSPEFYCSLSANYNNTTFWGIMGTVFPKKKTTSTLNDGMSPAGGSDANQVG